MKHSRNGLLSWSDQLSMFAPDFDDLATCAYRMERAREQILAIQARVSQQVSVLRLSARDDPREVRDGHRGRHSRHIHGRPENLVVTDLQRAMFLASGRDVGKRHHRDGERRNYRHCSACWRLMGR